MQHLKKLVGFIVLFQLTTLTISAQTLKQIRNANRLFKDKGEIHFRFLLKKKEDQKSLTRVISIDHVHGDTAWAYASKKGLLKFYELGYSEFKLLPTSAEEYQKEEKKSKAKKGPRVQSSSFNTYPTYPEYEQIMQNFQNQFPNLCQLVNLGVLPSGRKILALKISDSISLRQNEPRFLYTSTMHGDETVGYPLMLKLIDTLLRGYGSDFRLTRLVNEMEIWINPLANPDGTYRGGNASVANATRFNINNVDLNRNFPDPQDGPHPDGEVYQPETKIFMHLADSLSFVMAANFHSGAEVANYPWDTWQRRPADENWWIQTSSRFVDSARAGAPSNYFSTIYGYPNFPGVTQGFEWYEVNGGRQDYMNWFKQCRELTVELSDVKILPASQIAAHWGYLRESLLGYMEAALQGIRGRITDICTGQPIRAKVFVQNVDKDSSHIFSDLPLGNYHRPILPGTYQLVFSAPGYQTITLSNISCNAIFPTFQNLAMQPLPPKPKFKFKKGSICSNQIQFQDVTGSGNVWFWDFGDGQTSVQKNPVHTYQNPGYYRVKLRVQNCAGTDSLILDSAVAIVQPSPPLVSGDSSFCGARVHNLSALSPFPVSWYESATGGLPLDTAAVFQTPPLTAGKTYFAQTFSSLSLPRTGAKNNGIGTGGFFTANTYHYLIFNAYHPFVLKSVQVYANTAGNRTIQIRNAQGQVIAGRVVNIPQGSSRVLLDLPVLPGEGYQLGISGGASNNLFRNQNGASYPYAIDGLMEITGNSAGDPGFYYFFYDWEVTSRCESARIPVTAYVENAPAPSVSITAAAASVCEGDSLLLTASVQNALNPQISWLKGDTVLGSGSSFLFENVAGSYSVRAKLLSSDTCAVNNPALSAPFQISVLPRPDAPIITIEFPNGVTTATCAVPLIWFSYPDSVQLNTVPLAQIDVTDYLAVFGYSIGSNGCKSELSAPLICISIQKRTGTGAKVWFSEQHLNIRLKELAPGRVWIFNSLGQLATQFRTGAEESRLPVSHLPAGMYWVRLEGEARPFVIAKP